MSSIEAMMKVCEEAPVELIVNGRTLVTFMCTPQRLNELAVGYLYNRGLISKLEDVLSCGACEDMRKIYVNIKEPPTEQQYSIDGILSSACGSGSVLTKKVEKLKPSFSITLERLQILTKKMLKNATLYKETGGVHSASLINEDELVICREDIGRHNAVDKVIGKALFMGLDLSHNAVITTGRISTDIVLKAAISRIPLIASRSIPSSLAVEIAEELGLTLVGRILSRPVVYTHPCLIKVVDREQVASL